MMLHRNLSSRMKKLMVIVGLVILGTMMMAIPGKDAFANGGPESICAGWAGDWDPVSETCTIKQADYVAKFSLNDWYSFVARRCGFNEVDLVAAPASDINTVVLRWVEEYFISQSCSFVAPGSQTRSKCKLFDVDSNSMIGNSHTIKATYLGKAAYLRLGNGEQYYQLPMVPGSEQYAGGNLWSAHFYTTDLLTGEPLAPAGKYKARCFGPSGTIGGVGTITLGQ